MRLTSIDKALMEMQHFANCLNELACDAQKSGFKFQAVYLPPPFRQKIQQWQEQLDRLYAMRTSTSEETAQYNHEGISRLATIFGLKYSPTKT